LDRIRFQLDEHVPQAVPFEWISADLGQPRVELEDKEALRAILDGES
jgi:hypothetical protein